MELTRRQNLQMIPAAIVPFGISGCSEYVLYGELIVHSILSFAKEHASELGVDLAGHIIYEHFVKYFLDSSEKREVAMEAEKSGSDPTMAVQMAQAVGKNAVLSCLNEGTPIWCQHDRTNLAVNRFSIKMQNKTDRPINGRVDLGIFDESGAMEGPPIKNRPYMLVSNSQSGGQPYILRLKYTGELSPGKKVLRVIHNDPTEMRSDAVKFVVAPGNFSYA